MFWKKWFKKTYRVTCEVFVMNAGGGFTKVDEYKTITKSYHSPKTKDYTLVCELMLNKLYQEKRVNNMYCRYTITLEELQ